MCPKSKGRYKADAVDRACVKTYILRTMNMKKSYSKAVLCRICAFVVCLICLNLFAWDQDFDQGGLEQEPPNAGSDWQYFSTVDRSFTISGELIASAAFLWEQGKRGVGTVARPADARAMFQVFDHIEIQPDGNHSFRVGDSLDVITIGERVSHGGKRYRLTRRIGRVVIGGATERNVTAQIVKLWDTMKGGETIVPANSFKPLSFESLEKASHTIETSVLTRVEDTETPYPMQMFLIDKGKDAGVRMGDVFSVLGRKSRLGAEEEFLMGSVIHLSDNYATLLIVKMFENRLGTGNKALLRMRMSEEW